MVAYRDMVTVVGISTLLIFVVLTTITVPYPEFSTRIGTSSLGAYNKSEVHNNRGWDIFEIWQSDDNYSIVDVSAGDINKDGYIDIVACGGNVTKLYLNMKNGSFAPIYEYTYNDHIILRAEIEDMNNDGKADIVLLCTNEEPSAREVLEIRVLGQRNNLTDFVATTLEEIEDVYGTGAPSMAIGDIDKKNGKDIVISYTTSSEEATVISPSVVKLTVLYNTGMFGAFVKDDIISYESDPNSGRLWSNVALGDFDKDGNLDAVLTVDGYEQYYYNNIYNKYYNTTVAVFQTVNGYLSHIPVWNATIPYSMFVYGLDVGDFNNDGKEDIAISTDRKYISGGWTVEYNDGHIYVCEGQGNMNFSVPKIAYTRTDRGPIYGIEAGSFDEYAGIDLVFFQIVNEDDTYKCRIEFVGNYNTATGQFNEIWSIESLSYPKTRAIPGIERVFAICVANFDNSGCSDIAYGGWNIHVLTIKVDFGDVIPPQVPWLWAYDTPNDDGRSITVEWQEPSDPSVKSYRIYCSMAYLTNVQGMQPEMEVNKGVTKAKITTHDNGQPLENKVEYFIAVTTVNVDNVENTVVACIGPVIPMDNKAPGNPKTITVEDVPNDNGGAIRVTWSKVTAVDFEAYNIYIEQSGYDNCIGLNPKKQVRDRDQTSIEISDIRGVPLQDEVYYFVTVTAMDKDGNEDRHNVIVKSVMSHDNLPPEPIDFVYAEDVANDNGGAFDITWKQCTDPHFDHYNIYISRSNFNDVSTMTPTFVLYDREKTTLRVTKINGENVQNNVTYYIAVTSVDYSGNEETSVTPTTVVPLDNIPPSHIYSITVDDVPDDNGESLKVSWSAVNDDDFQKYVVYMASTDFTKLSDNGVSKVAEIFEINRTYYIIDKYNNEPLVVGKEYYFTVVAVDVNGNLGIYDNSGNYILTVASGHTVDNLYPKAIGGVTLLDKDNDYGGALVVSWQQSTDEDFDHYNIYVDIKPILSVEGMTPDYVVTERTVTTLEITKNNNRSLIVWEEYYVAVTAVDINGNEDKNTSQSYAGPAVPANNIPPRITIVKEGNNTIRSDESARYVISVTYHGPNTLKYIWLVDQVPQVPLSNEEFIYKPKASDVNSPHVIKVIVIEDIENGLSDTHEWEIFVEPAPVKKSTTSEGKEKGGLLSSPEGFYSLLVILIIVIVILVIVVYRYKKKRSAEKAAEDIEREIIEAEEESEEELRAKLEAERKKSEGKKVGGKLPKPEEPTALLPEPSHEKTPKLSPPRDEKPTLKVKRKLPPPQGPKIDGEMAQGPLPPATGTPSESVVKDSGEIDKALEMSGYMDLLTAMEAKEEIIPETKIGGAGEAKVTPEPRTGGLKEGEEIKRDNDGWIIECVMKNTLPSKYVCPDEQKSTCKLPCIQKMNK